jgi:hypothetical protein
MDVKTTASTRPTSCPSGPDLVVSGTIRNLIKPSSCQGAREDLQGIPARPKYPEGDALNPGFCAAPFLAKRRRKVPMAKNNPKVAAGYIQCCQPITPFDAALVVVLSHEAPPMAGPNARSDRRKPQASSPNKETPAREASSAVPWYQESNKEDILAKKFRREP